MTLRQIVVTLACAAMCTPSASAQVRLDPDVPSPVVPALIQTAARGWVDVNVGLANSLASESLFLFSNVIDLATAYGKPSLGAEFDFGGGYMFTPRAGLGLSFSGAAHQDVIGLGAGIGSLVLASGATDKMLRTEGAAHFQAVLVPVHSDRFRARIFGGPSYFQYKAEMVRDFGFARSQITTVDIVDIEGAGFGFHVGGDATYFFSRVVGLGVFGRYSRATATIDEPMSEEKQSMTLGGLQTGGGLRFRF